jgi:hypothetical protein
MTRYSPTTLARYFAQVVMDILLPVNKPLVLVHIRLWVLSHYHKVLDSGEMGMFCFGGRQQNMANTMYPYIRLLSSYKDYDKPGYGNGLPSARKLCFYKYMLMRTATPV